MQIAVKVPSPNTVAKKTVHHSNMAPIGNQGLQFDLEQSKN